MRFVNLCFLFFLQLRFTSHPPFFLAWICLFYFTIQFKIICLLCVNATQVYSLS